MSQGGDDFKREAGKQVRRSTSALFVRDFLLHCLSLLSKLPHPQTPIPSPFPSYAARDICPLQGIDASRIRMPIANQDQHASRPAPLPVPTSAGPAQSEGGSFFRSVQSVLGGAVGAVANLFVGAQHTHLSPIRGDDALDSVSDLSSDDEVAVDQWQQYSPGGNKQLAADNMVAAQSLQLLSQQPAASASTENGNLTEDEALQAAVAASMKDDSTIVLDADEFDFECTIIEEFDVSFIYKIDRPNRSFFMRGRIFDFAGERWRLKVFPFGTPRHDYAYSSPEYKMQVFIELVRPAKGAGFPITFNFTVSLLNKFDDEARICLKGSSVDNDLFFLRV